MRKNLVKRICIILIIIGLILIPISLSRYQTTHTSTVHLNVIKQVFTVIFNANGGTGTMTPQEILIDTDTDLKPNEYTRQDYLFTGWNTQDDGQGTDYADEASVRNLAAQNASITLYAQWEEIQGVAEINGRYFNTIADAITACPGTSGNPATTPTTIRILCDVEENIAIPKGKNIILNLNSHTLSNSSTGAALIENTGTLVVKNGTLTKETTSQHALINNNPGGYLEVVDATLIAKGSNKAQGLYNNGGTAIISGNTTISAESTNRATIVTLNGSGHTASLTIAGGTITSQKQSAVRCESGTVIIGTEGAPADTAIPMLQGKLYGLDNYNNDNAYFYDGICKGETKGINKTIPTSRIETGCSIVTGTEGSYKTAYLEPSNTITFKYNDGTNNEEIMYRDTGATLGTLPEPTSEGYIFDGWYTAADGGTQITSNTTVSGDVTYFAHWIHKKLVEFDANGGSVSEASRYVANGDEVGELPVPEYAEHRFDGWFTDRTNGTQVTSSTTITSDIILYAHWTEIYTVLFDPNGGKLANASDREKEVEHGAQIGSLPTPTRTSSTFQGWYTERTGGTQVTASTAITADTTLYAHWNGPNVASIDGITYPTLQDAIDDVPTDGTKKTIVFLTDITENVTTVEGQNIELDIGSYTLNKKSENAVILNYCTLTITNGTITSNAGFAAINNYSTGTIIMTGGSILATGSRQAIYNDAGHIEISGTAYLSSTNMSYNDRARGTVHNINNGTIVITGGTIVAEKESAIRNESGIITIGSNDGTVSTSSPVIRGTKYGLNNSSTIYFYDGVVRVPTGKTLITGTIPSTPNGYAIAESTETIDGVTYKTAYLNNAIAIPTANTGLVYDGAAQTGVQSNNNAYTLTGDTATAAGTYTATASLKYPSISTWSDGTTADKTITYTIDKATVTPMATADDKEYDGTTAGTGTISLTGVISGDTVTASASSFTFASPEVGTGITVTASGITISGTDAANYQLSTTTVETTADITDVQNNSQSLPNAQMTTMGLENNTKMINTINSNDIQGAQLTTNEAITDEENQASTTNLDETSIMPENMATDEANNEISNTNEENNTETKATTDIEILEIEEPKEQETLETTMQETEETKEQETLGTAMQEIEETKEQETLETTMQETEETLETTMQETEETKETTTP